MKIKLFNKKKPSKWILKARKKEGGRTIWEDVAEFDEPVKPLEVGDIIENLTEEGYDAFRLDGVDDRGKKLVVKWVKYMSRKSKEDVETRLSQLEKELNTMMEFFVKLQEMFGGGRKTVQDILAELLYYEQLKEKLGEIMVKRGLVKTGESGGELKEIFELLQMLKQFQSIAPQTIPQPQQVNQVKRPQETSITTPPQEPLNQEVNPEELKKLKKEAEEEVREAIIEAIQEAHEKELPPCMKGEECA